MTKWKPTNAGIALLSMCLCLCSVASAQSVNPILKVDEPGFLYTADPAAEVFDGKVYVYCSHDQPDARNYSSMQDYIVLESSDLKTWINHGVVLKPREYSWASGQMNAPDVAFKDGWYYFYFPYEKTHIGVAKSKSPIGPWSEAVTNKICTIFDPCVFVDDDGQAYIYGNDHKVDIGDKGWHVMGARLKPNMIELDGPWQRLSEEEVNEAVTVFKRNGKYYFMARKDKKTVYFMSDSPLPAKPYATFKGAVTEDVKGAPAHTSAIEFKGQWVLFYHLGAEVNNGTPCRRSVCFDKMEFNDDGTIRPVSFTLEASGRGQNEVSSRAEEVMIVAHRGASRDAPQNTLPAFKLAWEQEADAIEGDFRLTKDGHIVCIHDENTERVATTNLVVHESTLAELRTLDVGAHHGEAFKGTVIPTISEVLATIPEGKRIYIEVKCGAEIIPSLLEKIKESGLKPEQIAVISFDHEVIQGFKAKAPQYKAFLLCSFNERKNGQIRPPLASVMRTLKQVRADGLFSSTNVPLPVIEAVRQQGYEWHAWTINDLTEARRMTGMGAQSIITDVPGYMKKHLGKPSPAGEAAPADDVWPGAKSSFRGFDQYNFVLDGVPCKVAVPRTVAAGRPWVWRALFWGNAPQFDVAMLERGYHVVYCHVADLFGNAEAVKRWNAFYNYLRLEHLLSDRAVLEGMSRGGLIVYNWAAANPDKVQAIYADAPVMNFTSWPGGKGQGKGDARLWEACLEAYGLTEEEAMAFKGHPLDNLAPLAKAGVPIIHVVGDADDVVPVAENTAIAEARYKKLGGQFEVIHKKDVGHHPHSLENPQPIVDFVIRQDSAQDKRGHVATGSGRAAELAVAGIFTDGMVLQRGVAVPVWGTAYPGATVTVRFAGQEKNSMVDENGRWMISLDPLKASAEGRTMVISSPDSGSTLQVSDVLVGEVWLVGGQSNADWTLTLLTRNPGRPEEREAYEYLLQEIATANDPLLRQFAVNAAASPLNEIDEIHSQTGWTRAVKGAVDGFSGTGYFFGRELRMELGVPVGLIDANLGGTRIEPWIPAREYMKTDAGKAFYEQETALTEEKRAPRKNASRIPAALYNAFIHPLAPYALKGIVWYQGESNTEYRTEYYRESMLRLINGWRDHWGQNDLPFIWCQLANKNDPNTEPNDGDFWVLIQDQQRDVLALTSDTGMAVLNDIGDARNVHPKNKMDAGRRLALWAFHDAYDKEIVCSGPLFKSAEIKGSKVIIKFDHAGSGLMAGRKNGLEPVKEVDEPLKRFQICGADRQWKWAEAKIAGSDTVEVWHDEIADPVEVRYAWASNPKGANLYNKEGLPASIFKTK